jgi:LCP family protein required for cell wall assembly
MKPTVTADTGYQEIIEYGGHTYKYNEDVVSFAFMGVDQRELKSSDETDYVGAADTDIVAAVDTKTGKAKVIAIPRDTMTDIDITTDRGIFLRTDRAQLCLAYAYGDGEEGSAKSTVEAMSRILMGVPIEKYFTLDLNGIKPLNDAIGGVTVKSLYTFKNQGINEGEEVTLHGDMAETYIRIRDLDDVEASLNRTDRQVQYIKAYAAQVLPAVLKDFGVIRNLYDLSSKYSHTNLSLSNVTYMGSLLLSKGVSDFDAIRIEGEMKEGHSDNMPEVTHAEFYPDEDSLMQAVLSAFYTQID